ncbi:MAG TPA: hypothetical protein VGN39_12280 [Terriglobales bacterium]|jgi:hypothetical protein|nr:hypothetical protein [Terriglobales bacterium]
MNDELKLLVEWSSPWEEFITAIRPALSRSAAPLAAEARSGLFPYRGMLGALIVEIVLVAALILLPSKLRTMQAFQPTPPPQYDVIYFSGDELPKTEDAGGARSGRSGRSGGSEGHHATQVIRVARGPALKEQIVDAPKLNLPNSNSAVANLLAFKSLPGPPPDKGLESSLRHAEMPLTAIPPPAAVQEVSPRSAPNMQAQAIAPSPSALRHELTSRHVYEAQESAVPPPVSAPNVPILNPRLTLPQSLVVPPSPSEREIRTAVRLSTGDFRNQTVVPPAPQANNDLTERRASRAYESSEDVVPPTVSAPKEIANLHSQLTLPQSGVVPPAPSAREIRTNAGFPAGDLRKQTVVPPAPQASTLFTNRQAASVGNVAAVAPAAQVNNVLSGRRQAATVGNAVVGPPSQLSNVSFAHGQGKNLGDSGVVPPPAQLSGSLSSGSLTNRQAAGLSGKVAAVQPPPSASTGSGSNGQGRRGPGEKISESVVPPSPALASGIVLSARPGPKVGSPSDGSAGSLAMSPSGGTHPGLGGTGGGESISHGNGPGSSTSGEGSGAKTNGSGQGSTETAHNGISPFPGPGGAGRGTAPPTMPGVSVSGGGNNTVKLPSFGTDGAPVNDPAHSPAITNPGGPGITVVATSHSGGAFNFYGALKGDRVYTIYIDTALGTAVMQFADPKSATQSYPEDLTAPQALRAELPFDVTPSRLVIACTLDRSGLLKTPRVLQANSSELSEKVLAALASWKFRPVFRGNQPVEVNAILGFDIDTQ